VGLAAEINKTVKTVRVGQRPNFAYPFQVADDAMQMDVHKTLYYFYHISLCWLNLNSQSFV